MKPFVNILAAALMMGGAAIISAVPANAQDFGVTVGVGGPGWYDGYYNYDRPCWWYRYNDFPAPRRCYDYFYGVWGPDIYLDSGFVFRDRDDWWRWHDRDDYRRWRAHDWRDDRSGWNGDHAGWRGDGRGYARDWRDDRGDDHAGWRGDSRGQDWGRDGTRANWGGDRGWGHDARSINWGNDRGRGATNWNGGGWRGDRHADGHGGGDYGRQDRGGSYRDGAGHGPGDHDR